MSTVTPDQLHIGDILYIRVPQNRYMQCQIIDKGAEKVTYEILSRGIKICETYTHLYVLPSSDTMVLSSISDQETELPMERGKSYDTLSDESISTLQKHIDTIITPLKY